MLQCIAAFDRNLGKKEQLCDCGTRKWRGWKTACAQNLVLHSENHAFTCHLLVLDLVFRKKLELHSEYHEFPDHLYILNFAFKKIGLARPPSYFELGFWKLVPHSKVMILHTTLFLNLVFLILNLFVFQQIVLHSLNILIVPITFLFWTRFFKKDKLVPHTEHHDFTHHLLIWTWLFLFWTCLYFKNLYVPDVSWFFWKIYWLIHQINRWGTEKF